MSTDNADDQALIEAHARFVALDEDGMMDAAEEFQESAYALGLARGRLAAERQVGELRAALEDANSLCRSCYQVVERIAVVERDVALGSGFGRLHQALSDSLERQHKVMFPETSAEGKDHG